MSAIEQEENFCAKKVVRKKRKSGIMVIHRNHHSFQRPTIKIISHRANATSVEFE